MRNKYFIKILTVYRNTVKFPRNLLMNIECKSIMYPLKGFFSEFFPDSQNYTRLLYFRIYAKVQNFNAVSFSNCDKVMPC